jgi:Flp pilus assembly protein protease CpaA
MIVPALMCGVVVALVVWTSITDIRTRDVPGLATRSALFFAIILRIILALQQASWMPLIYGLLGVVVLGGTGYILYHYSLWGGGDFKLMLSLGALLGLNDPFFPLVFCIVGVCYLFQILLLKLVMKRRGIIITEMPFVPPIAMTALLFLWYKGIIY